MSEHPMWQGGWQDLKNHLRQRWEHLREEDLERARGSFESLVTTVHQQTGATREEVERFLGDVGRGISAGSQQAVEAARDFAQAASEQFHHSSEQAAAMARESYENAQEMVRRRPVESLALCFGVGVVTGVIVGLVLRSK